MSQDADAGLRPDQALDELQAMATLEHAHCVYYLRLHYALGGPPADHGDQRPEAVQAAARAAALVARNDMFHLKDVNRILVMAGREPVVDRATEVKHESGPPIDLRPMTADQFQDFPAREKALAAALDRRYDRLRAAASSPMPPFTGDLLDELRFLLNFVSGEGSDHASQALGLAANLAGLRPQEYLLVHGIQPVEELDRRLVALSEEFYGSLLVILRQHFAQGDLRDQAVSRMDDLDKVNGLLGLRGLLPPFTAP